MREAADAVRVRMLGEFAVTVPGGRRLSGRSLECDLVYVLALTREPLPAGTVTAMLWPGAATAWTAERLGQLRRRLDERGARGSVVRAGGDVQLDPGAVRCDLWDAFDALDRISVLQGDGESDRARAAAAAALQDLPQLLTASVAAPHLPEARELWQRAQDHLVVGQRLLRRLAGLPS